MFRYITRRLVISVLVLLAASVLIYVLTINSGDPLAGLRENPDPAAARMIESKTRWMGLDLPWYERYWGWFTGVAGCVTLACDFGTDAMGQDVGQAIGSAAGATLRLVTIATLLAIVVGIAVGILSAIRQYSGFDYVVTFGAFLFYSLPVFWAAVLLKDFGAIRFNTWIRDPAFTVGQILGISVALGVILQFVLGGAWRRRLLTGGAATAFAVGALFYFNAVGWYREPRLGIGVIALVGAGAAVLVTMLVAGLRHRRVLWAALTTVGVGIVAVLVLDGYLDEPTGAGLAGLLVLALALAAVVGYAWGGFSRRTAIGVSMTTALVMSLTVAASYLADHWSEYLDQQGRRPIIGTIGESTPGFSGGFWATALDQGTQLLLPTTVLVLISVASYSRYTRASMLEVMGQDYVRTARSKGLSERTVIVRHAFRNALIPITTIVAMDFAALIGGAVITERVFGWNGMGSLFATGLSNVDPNPVMAFFLVTGSAAIVMNLVADILYATLDPRIRR